MSMSRAYVIADTKTDVYTPIITRDSRMSEMVKRYFSPSDFSEVKERMIGSGTIGGKACGMLLARAIIRENAPKVYERLQRQDSFFVGTDVYVTYLIENGLWSLAARQSTDDGWFKYADELRESILHGKLSEKVREQLACVIEHYGHAPYIVRSSSLLEDGFGNAFAGIYKSVFCFNQGSFEERLRELEKAVKTVYASTMSSSALDYRKRRGLDRKDERMALLIQRASGSLFGSLFMPCAAGVGYSYSPYRVTRESDPNSGMLRLVAGLGTGAVNRSKGTYPRIVSLDMPERTVYSSTAEAHKYSQQMVEVINTKKRCVESVGLGEFEPLIPREIKNLLLENDSETEAFFKAIGRPREIRFISCKGLVEDKALMGYIRTLLECLQNEYGCPVNIEFTIDPADDGKPKINLLQCRPIRALYDKERVEIPNDIDRKNVLLESIGSSMGLSRIRSLDYIVRVDPEGYYKLPYSEKRAVSDLIGKINRHFRDLQCHLMLIVPGRIGTSSPELGVPTEFSDISGFDLICETENSDAGYNPELSYGSHIFQDLVEENILYTAVFNNSKTLTFSPEILLNCEDVTAQIIGKTNPSDIVTVFKPDNCKLYYDMRSEHLLISL